MSLYKQEFGQNFDLGFGLKDHPYLIDKSWHNNLRIGFIQLTSDIVLCACHIAGLR